MIIVARSGYAAEVAAIVTALGHAVTAVWGSAGATVAAASWARSPRRRSGLRFDVAPGTTVAGVPAKPLG